MKASELRIGNFHNYDTGEGIEVAITDVEDLVYLDASPNDENYQPIPLTEEWLLKFGFEIRHIGDFIEADKDIVEFNGDIIKDREGELRLTINVNMNSPILYIHQLQNLYFALTGEELEIKVPA